jgi:hypothetical protein
MFFCVDQNCAGQSVPINSCCIFLETRGTELVGVCRAKRCRHRGVHALFGGEDMQIGYDGYGLSCSVAGSKPAVRQSFLQRGRLSCTVGFARGVD